MTNDEYIEKLTKALAGIDKQSRQDILREIRSHIADLGDSGDSLVDRFGTPAELARQYLESEPIKPRTLTKVVGVSKKIAAVVGMASLVLIVGIVSFFWYVSQDDFNYADENSAELAQTGSWQSAENHGNSPLHINISQAQAVIYWHDKREIRWRCKGRHSPNFTAGGELQIRHSECLIFLPRQDSDFDLTQASVVLVRPQASTNLQLTQSYLRIAENGQQYQYSIETRRSASDDFESWENAEIKISVVAVESAIQRYSF